MKKRSAFDEVRQDEYTAAPDAEVIGKILIERIEEHGPLADALIGYLFRDHEVRAKGKVEVATAHLASRLISGGGGKYWNRLLELKIIELTGFQPDFIILIDRNIWGGLTIEQRVALVDHELSHCRQAEDIEGVPKFNQQTGEPVWTIVGHDIEEFNAVAQRHGAWSSDIHDFVTAAIQGITADITPATPVVNECAAALADPAAAAHTA